MSDRKSRSGFSISPHKLTPNKRVYSPDTSKQNSEESPSKSHVAVKDPTQFFTAKIDEDVEKKFF